jgi:hypothetical protein
MIETLALDRADEPLREGILPGAVRGCARGGRDMTQNITPDMKDAEESEIIRQAPRKRNGFERLDLIKAMEDPDLFQPWSRLRSGRGLERRLNYYATRGLFVIDEIGYLSYDARAADLL